MHTGTPRRAATLLAQARQLADEEHAKRLAELHQLAPLLERLQPVLPALADAGLELHPQQISLCWHYARPATGGCGVRKRVLRIHTRTLTFATCSTQRWLDVLLAQGFREIHRDAALYYPGAVLQRGHLLVRVDCPTPAAVLAAEAKAQQQRRAEDAFAGAEA